MDQALAIRVGIDELADTLSLHYKPPRRGQFSLSCREDIFNLEIRTDHRPILSSLETPNP
ncbi:hypothetical protein OAG62_00995 [bacterium]|nr:hypothetical protein [bacterium]